MTYAEKLKDPRWQKKRLKILGRDDWSCQLCDDHNTTLHIHHWEYAENPWDVENEDLITLCKRCHKLIECLKSSSLDRDIQKVINFPCSDNKSILIAAIIGSQDKSGKYSVLLYDYYEEDERLIWLTSMSPKYFKTIHEYFQMVKELNLKTEAP